MTIYELAAEWQRLEDELYENGGVLTEEMEAQMAETKESLKDKIDNYQRLIARLTAQAAEAKVEEERLSKLRRTAENSVKSLKNHILGCMQAFGLDKIEGELCKVSTARVKSVECNNDTIVSPYEDSIRELNATLPSWITLEPKVSKTTLKEVLASGCEVDGAQIVTGLSLRIR